MGLEKSSLMAEGFLYFRLIQGKPSAWHILSSRVPLAPSTLKLYNHLPRARPHMWAPAARVRAARAGGGASESFPKASRQYVTVCCLYVGYGFCVCMQLERSLVTQNEAFHEN
jgi:hypothetical protein